MNEASEETIEIASGKCDSFEAHSMITTIKMNKNQFCAIRDRWGTRTFYYCLVKDGFYFASDIRFILSLSIEDINRYDEGALIETSTLGYILSSDRTLFEHIKQLPRN